MKCLTLLRLLCIVFSLTLLLHHRLEYGIWFQLHQVLHHETFELLSLAFLAGTYIGPILEKINSRLKQLFR